MGETVSGSCLIACRNMQMPTKNLSRRRLISLLFSVAVLVCEVSFADSTRALCDIYRTGEDQVDRTIPCTFSQRQGYITIVRSDDVIHELSPVGDSPGNFTDQYNNRVYRQSGLGDQGQIFRFPEISIFLYWNPPAVQPSDEGNPTSPFSTADFDATTLLRCRESAAADPGSCPAGIVRMEDNQASITVLNLRGERFTINFMKDYVNATNREVRSRLEGDTYILEFANGEIWDVPIAAIEGG